MSKIFVYHKNKFELTDAEVSLSPYLTTLVNTNLPVDRDKEGNIQLQLDISPSTFQNYINFLRGRSFFLSETDLDFFDFMGHDNYYEYNAEYWKSMLEGTRHNKCGDLTDKIDTITAINVLEPLASTFANIDLYYVGDTALLTAGIINKASVLPIIYHINDKPKILKALGKTSSNANIFQFNVELSSKVVSSNDTKKAYKTFKPLLQPDSESRRVQHPDKIWNGRSVQCTMFGLNFDCMEELLYLFPADTDGIVMHVKSGKLHKSLALVRSYRSYVTRQVNLIPEYLHHEQYLLRLCNLSLMGFTINVPKFKEIVGYDEYKKERLLLRSGTESMQEVPYSSKVTYLNNPIKSKELRLTKEDYIALLSIGPTRPSHTLLDIPGKYSKKDIDINELYTMSQIVQDTNMIEYQYLKHELDNMVYDGTYYRIGRIDTYDIPIMKDKYIVGPSVLEALKYDKGIIQHKFYSSLPDVSSEILDQCYCNVEDGIVYASLPLIDVLYNNKIPASKYSNDIVKRLL